MVSAQDVVSGLQVLEAMAPAVSPALRPHLLGLLPSLLRGLLCPFTAIRHMCARCMTAMAKVDLHHTLQVRHGAKVCGGGGGGENGFLDRCGQQCAHLGVELSIAG